MTRAPGTRLVALTIPGPAGALEALLNEREGHAPSVAALVCHPHPRFGGTMNNKVVHHVATTLHELGAAVLRFNFRGVGKSEGAYDEGEGELEDARACLGWLRARHPAAKPWVAGFSFGAWVAARLAASEPAVERLIMVAPGVGQSDYSAMRESAVPKLVVQGTADTTCRPEILEAEFPSWRGPKELVLVEGATHFFDRKLAELGRAVGERASKR